MQEYESVVETPQPVISQPIAQQPVASQPAATTPKNDNNKGLLIFLAILAAILLLALGGGLAYLLLNNSTGKTDNTNNMQANGMPSNGTPGQPGNSGNGSGTSSSGSVEQTVTASGYSQSEGTVTQEEKDYSADGSNNSAIIISNGAIYTLSGSSIKTTSNTTSNDESSFYGLNAAVLVKSAAQMTLTDSTITTNGSGTNGAFATGSSSKLTLQNVTINAVGGGAHGVMATNGGIVSMSNVDIVTTQANSGAIATDRGGGTITAEGGTIRATGADSPGIYSTGEINVSNADVTATGAEVVVIEGGNSVNLSDTDLTSTYDNKWGVMMYQSMSGDAAGTSGTYTQTGGALAYSGSNGPLFYSTNTTSNIYLSNVALSASSGVLLKAAAGNWGTSGSNGGTANLTATDQAMDGNITVDSISSVSISLKENSSLRGAIDNANTAKKAELTLDATSTWTLTADSHLTALVLPESAISGNTISSISGNGYNVYYDSTASANSYLNGGTYTLSDGGKLLPE